ELALRKPVDPLHLLLLPELARILGEFPSPAARPALPVLAGGIAASLHRALLGEAAGPLEEQLDAFAPAEPASRTGVTSHESDPALLGRAAPVVGDRRHVFDGDHTEP